VQSVQDCLLRTTLFPVNPPLHLSTSDGGHYTNRRQFIDDNRTSATQEKSSGNHYTLSHLKTEFEIFFPLAFDPFAQSENFNFVWKDGYGALEAGRAWSQFTNEMEDELYISNTNSEARGPPILRCHSERFREPPTV
jgi:hypothetical protein